MTIALIAGAGGLPPVLAAALVAQGKAPVICEMRGFTSQVEGEFERIAFRIETLATFLKDLQIRGVTQVCMAGAVERPIVDPTAIDAATLPLVPRLQAAMAKGDDGTLREIIMIFEERGFEVLGGHEVAPQLLPAAGVHTVLKPGDLVFDLAVARAELAEMGAADLGQAVVIRDGKAIAREGERGTAAMLESLSEPTTPSNGTFDPFEALITTVSDAVGQMMGVEDVLEDVVTGEDAILFKAPKPNQNLLADMPTIGPDTAVQAAAGLSGLVITHGGVMVLDLPEVVATLDAHGMFLLVTL